MSSSSPSFIMIPHSMPDLNHPAIDPLALGTRKRRCSSEDLSSTPQRKRLRASSSPSKRSRRRSESINDSNARPHKRRRSLRKALTKLPDCSESTEDSVRAWVTTEQPGYSFAMPSSSQSSQNKRRRSQSSGKSQRHRSSTEATSADSDATSVKTIHDPRTRTILLDNGISYEASRQSRAQNHDEILTRLTAPRGSLSPSRGFQLEEEFDKFVAAHDLAPNEDTLLTGVFFPWFHRAMPPCGLNSSFSTLPTLTEGQLPAPKPDIYFGEPFTSLAPEARRANEKNVVPFNRSPYIAVNQTTELKGLAGKADVARTQAMYNGAAGARTMDSLRRYSNPESLDRNARAYSATFASGTLSLYVTHSKPTERGFERDYVTQQIAGEMATASPSQFRRALELYRNQSDLAREDRVQAISDANAKNSSTGPPEVPEATLHPSNRECQASLIGSASCTHQTMARVTSVDDQHTLWMRTTIDRLTADGLSEAEARQWVRDCLVSALGEVSEAAQE